MAKIDDLIPSAKEIQKQAALKEEAQKADEHAKHLAAAEAEKKAMIRQAQPAIRFDREEKAGLNRDPARSAQRAQRGASMSPSRA